MIYKIKLLPQGKREVCVTLIWVIIAIYCLFGAMGCGSARMSTTVFDKEGKVVSESEIKIITIGSRKLEKVDVNLTEGKVKIGKQSGSSGSLGKAMSDIFKIAAGATGMKAVNP